MFEVLKKCFPSSDDASECELFMENNEIFFCPEKLNIQLKILKFSLKCKWKILDLKWNVHNL